MSPEALPSFDEPPVIETVLGVQFDPLKNFATAHLGAFWKRPPSEWSLVEDENPLGVVFEQFGEERTWISPRIRLRVTEDRSTRLRIRNDCDDRMIQVQNERLHYNWMGRAGGEYPRYRNVRPEFDRILDVLTKFVEVESLGEVEPNQWEVTYVNHMPKGTVWNELRDWFGLFPTLLGSGQALSAGRLESFSSQ